jgi:hypothetical protein
MAVVPSPGLILPVSDRVDLVQGNPALSPTGIARIAMIAGVPSVSISGAAYASFGSAGAAPSGTVQPQVRYLPTDHLDFVMGDPPVSPKGCGRLAVTTAGVASVSIESAAYASLGVSGAASTGCQLFPGFLYSTDYVDIVQGNPAVSLPGTARIACFTGATTLSISINGAAYTTLGALSPPGTPVLWFDAQNIDGTNNSGLVNLQTIGTWLNLGSLGVGGNLAQATAGIRPQYVAVASAGKLNNKSCVRNGAANWMQTAALTLMNQPTLIAAVAMTTSIAAGTSVISDGRGVGRNLVGRVGAPFSAYAGAVQPLGGNFVINIYNSVNVNFNGAASVGRMDGVAGGAVNVGATGLDGVTIFSDTSFGSNWTGDIVELLIYNGGGQPTPAQVEAYFVSKYGATPQ